MITVSSNTKAKAPRSIVLKEKGSGTRMRVVAAYSVGFLSSISICIISRVLHFVETTTPQCSCWRSSYPKCRLVIY